MKGLQKGMVGGNMALVQKLSVWMGRGPPTCYCFAPCRDGRAEGVGT